MNSQPVNPQREDALGPDDQVVLRVRDVEEINEKEFRLDLQGNIDVPMIGRVKAGGLTTDELAGVLARRLARFVRAPDVSVVIKERRSRKVYVLGAVVSPGVYYLRSPTPLVEILSQAGGLKPEAGNAIRIVRKNRSGAIPLAGAYADPSGDFSTADLNIRSLMGGRNQETNIQIFPDDVIAVPKADVIYVIGCVRKPGGFALNDRSAISVLEALSLAEGLDRLAAPSRAKILRVSPGGQERIEMAVDIKKVLAGKSTDPPLAPDDILYIPSSGSKALAVRSLEAAITLGTGVVIYH